MRQTAAAALKRVPAIALAIPPRTRRRLLIALAIALVLFSVYRFWLRDSSFVKVEHVTVTGVTTKDAPRIRTALIAAAHDMTTLHVERGALAGAVAGFPIVRDVVPKPDFPHGLEIRVIEERPVAVLEVDGERLLLASDGSVLRGTRAGRPLPVIRSRGGVPQGALAQRAPLSALHVVAAAPSALAPRISSVGHGMTRGLVARLRNGPELIFGNDSRLAAKWAAAVAVLADPSSRGASYVDLRLPDRPVAGGLAASTLAPITSTGQDASQAANGVPQQNAGAATTQSSGLPARGSANTQP